MFTCMDHMKAIVMYKMATFEFGYAILWSVKAVLCIDNACHPTHLTSTHVQAPLTYGTVCMCACVCTWV